MSDVMGHGTIKEKAIQSGKWAFLARISQVLGSGILLVLLPYWLAPDEFGVITMFSSVLALGLLIQQAGFAEVTIRGSDNAEAIRDSAFWLNLVVGVLLYVLLFTFSPTISSFFHDPRLIIPLRIGGIQIIGAGLSNVPMAWLQRIFQFKLFALSHLVNSIVMIVVTLLLASRGFTYWAYVIGLLSGSLMRMMIVFIFLGWRPQLRFQPSDYIYILKFSGIVLLEMILGWCLIWFDNIVVARHLGSEAAGIYSLAFNIATLAISLPCSAITGLTLPTFSRLQTDMDALRSSYLRGTSLISAYAIPAGIGMFLISHSVVRFLYPSKWSELGSVLSVLALYSSFGYLWILNTDVFKAIGKPELMVKIYIFSVVIMLPIYWWSSQIGLLEFTFARSLIVLVGALPHTYYAVRYLKLEKNYLWEVSRAPLVASILMAVLVWFGIDFQQGITNRTSSILAVVSVIATGVAVYIAILRLLAPDFVRQTYTLLLRSFTQRTL